MKRNINNKRLRIVKVFIHKNILLNSLLTVIFLHRRAPHFLCFSNNQKSTKIHPFGEFLYQYARGARSVEFSDIIGNATLSLLNRQITGVFRHIWELYERAVYPINSYIFRPFYRVHKLTKVPEISGKISGLTRTHINQKVFSYLTALKGAVLPVRLPFGKRIGSTRTVPFRSLGFKPRI